MYHTASLGVGGSGKVLDSRYRVLAVCSSGSAVVAQFPQVITEIRAKESMSGNGRELDLISMKELIATLGVSRSTMYRMLKDGSFPQPIKLGPKRIAWRIKTVDEWIAAQEQGS